MEPRHTDRRGVYPRVPLGYESPARNDRDNNPSIVLRMRRKLYDLPDEEQLPQAPHVDEALTTPERHVEDIVLGNPDLPSFAKRQEIVDSVFNNQVTVVVGPTGSGKSTQVPQFLLAAGHDNIALTQPRIMAANGVGERIADELAGVLGDEARELVAVQTSERFEKPDGAKIFVRTDGLELAMDTDKYLSRLPYEQAQEEAAKIVLVIDEVHEGNENQVMLLALVHRMLDTYPAMRVVVMSATVNAEKYTSYFSHDGKREVPIVEIEGRPNEVEWQERPDVDAIQMISELVEDGDKLEPGDDILLFTSGKPEIETLIKKGIAAGLPLEFVRLHAKMEKFEQDRASAPHPDTIRVIVATDVAMTSLTFPNVKYVIDEGTVKNPELDEEGAEGLVPQLCSQAEIGQRGGRAGRVRPGVHITVRPHEETGLGFVTFDQRPAYPPPPIYSTDLSKSVLRLANRGYDFGEFEYIDPISSKAIRQAKDKLYDLGAIDEDDKITEMGQTMAKFSVLRPEHARMMAEAMQPNVPLNVLLNTALVAASYEAGGLRDFTKKAEKGHEPWRKIVRNPDHDAMLELELFRHIGTDAQSDDLSYLRSIGCDAKNVAKARKIYHKSIRALGIDQQYAAPLPLDGDEKAQLEHCIASGLIENIYVRNQTSHRGTFRYHHIRGEGAQRELSNRSVVQPKDARMVLGDPRFYMAQTKKGAQKVDIVERAQPLTPEQLDELDFREEVVTVGTVVQKGIMKIIKERRVGSMVRGRETTVASAEEISDGKMLELILNNPGASQRQLRELKTELEELQQLTTRKLHQIDQKTYETLLLSAIHQSKSTELHIIDAQLGVIMAQKMVMKERYVAAGLESEIRRNAVPTILAGDYEMPVVYEKGVPIVKHCTPDEVLQLPNDVRLPDGREVRFRVPKYDANGGRQARGYQDLPALRAREAVQRAHNRELAYR